MDHEEYFGAPAGGSFNALALARQTVQETFSSADFRNKNCDCPTIQVTAPKPDQVFNDNDLVPVEGKLIWPGDSKPGNRVKQVVIRDSSSALTITPDIKVQEDGSFAGKFRAGDLGSGGPKVYGLTLVHVFLDDDKLVGPQKGLGPIQDKNDKLHVQRG